MLLDRVIGTWHIKTEGQTVVCPFTFECWPGSGELSPSEFWMMAQGNGINRLQTEELATKPLPVKVAYGPSLKGLAASVCINFAC